MAYSGKFTPNNYKKYVGDPTKITYRSLWERNLMVRFDGNPNVLAWSSEEIVIPYYSPIDKKWHRYFTDFYIKTKKRDGTIREYIIEVKPKKQTVIPVYKKRITQRFLGEAARFTINEIKWKAAREYCLDRKWEFLLLTEDDIF